MLQLEVISFERELDLPLYSLSEDKTRQKSCFIDSNRIDTVEHTMIGEDDRQKTSTKFEGNNKNKP